MEQQVARSYRLLARAVRDRFPAQQDRLFSVQALVNHGLLILAYGLLVAGWLPPAAFVGVGLCLYIRNFHAIHEASHARRVPDWLGQLGMIVHSPLQLSWHDMVRDHHRHHRYSDDPQRNPYIALEDGPWWRAGVLAVVFPEFAWLQWARREGLRWALASGVLRNLGMCGALVVLGGTAVVWWLVVTRIGSLLAWLVFGRVLHLPRFWSPAQPMVVPRWVESVWSTLFTRDNWQAIRHHHLHHRYAHVPSRDRGCHATSVRRPW